MWIQHRNRISIFYECLFGLERKIIIVRMYCSLSISLSCIFAHAKWNEHVVVDATTIKDKHDLPPIWPFSTLNKRPKEQKIWSIVSIVTICVSRDVANIKRPKLLSMGQKKKHGPFKRCKGKHMASRLIATIYQPHNTKHSHKVRGCCHLPFPCVL